MFNSVRLHVECPAVALLQWIKSTGNDICGKYVRVDVPSKRSVCSKIFAVEEKVLGILASRARQLAYGGQGFVQFTLQDAEPLVECLNVIGGFSTRALGMLRDQKPCTTHLSFFVAMGLSTFGTTITALSARARP